MCRVKFENNVLTTSKVSQHNPDRITQPAVYKRIEEAPRQGNLLNQKTFAEIPTGLETSMQAFPRTSNAMGVLFQVNLPGICFRSNLKIQISL